MQRIIKPWGYELVWAHTASYTGKILAIRRGCRLSLQLHEQKEESLYLLSGVLEIELETVGGDIVCQTARCGATFHIPAGQRHRLKAVTACRVLEVATPQLGDIIRLQDDYGRC